MSIHGVTDFFLKEERSDNWGFKVMVIEEQKDSSGWVALLPELLVVVAEDMIGKGKKVDKFGKLAWNKRPKIGWMLYNGCEIVEDTQCCQCITITTWHWHLPHLELFFPSPIIHKYRSILSTANCPAKIASQSELSYFLDGSKNRFNSLKKVDRFLQVLKIGAALSHIYNLHYKLLNKVNRLSQSVSCD